MKTSRPAERSSIQSWILLACILTICGFLYLQNLGSAHITAWDEVVHVNVIKNLASNCCIPRLHSSQDLGADYRDWTNNTVWLHKPLLPFYLSAGSYNFFGRSLWAIRLPGVLFALLTITLIFLVGRRFLSHDVAVAAAAIFGFNPYTNELVHGREYAGFPDLELVFFLTAALYFFLHWAEKRSRASLILLGTAVGVAYLCKGGLALAPFAIALALILLTREVRAFKDWVLAIATLVVVVLPEALYLVRHFPAETHYENREQLWHLTRSMGGTGGPWYQYLVLLLPLMLTFPLVPFAYSAIVWGSSRIRADRNSFILALWCLAYVIPLSIGVSKVENHIYATLPAVALLVPQMTRNLCGHRQFKLLLPLCVSSIVTCLVVFFSTDSSHPIRLALITEIASFLLCFGVLYFAKFELEISARIALVLTTSALLAFCTWQDVVGNRTGDAPGEAELRTTGLDLQRRVDKSALVLEHDGSVDLADLYIMFWSGTDVLDVCRSYDPSGLLQHIENRNDLYLITAAAIPIHPLVALPAGNLYALKGVPPGTWMPQVEKACGPYDSPFE